MINLPGIPHEIENEIYSTSNEWGCIFDSPFSTTAEDLFQYYFFKFWLDWQIFPTYEVIHHKVHQTAWFPKDQCPGKDVLMPVYLSCLGKIS